MKQNLEKETKQEVGETSFSFSLPLLDLDFWEHKRIWNCSSKGRAKQDGLRQTEMQQESAGSPAPQGLPK